MSKPRSWLKTFIYFYLFFLCFHVGVLITYNGLLWQSEKYLKDHTPKTNLFCGKFNTDEAYWEIPHDKIAFKPEENCKSENCGTYVFEDSSQENADPVYVVSVEGHPVDTYQPIEVELNFNKPFTLVLVSKKIVGWNLKISDFSLIKKVVSVSPRLVWINNLPESIPFEFLGQEQICDHAWSGLEQHNPENQYRKLIMALREHLGQKESLFWGMPNVDKITLHDKMLGEMPGQKTNDREVAQTNLKDWPTQGIKWTRAQQKIKASTFRFKEGEDWKEMSVPEDSRAVIRDEQGELQLLKGFQYGTWSEKTKKFKAQSPSAELPPVYWPTAMAWDEENKNVLLFNNERGGELYSIKKNQWQLIKSGLNINLAGIAIDAKNKHIYGVSSRGKKINKIYRLNYAGDITAEYDVTSKIAFDEVHWRSEVEWIDSKLYLRIHNVAHPGGDVHELL